MLSNGILTNAASNGKPFNFMRVFAPKNGSYFLKIATKSEPRSSGMDNLFQISWKAYNSIWFGCWVSDGKIRSAPGIISSFFHDKAIIEVTLEQLLIYCYGKDKGFSEYVFHDPVLMLSGTSDTYLMKQSTFWDALPFIENKEHIDLRIMLKNFEFTDTNEYKGK